MTPEQIRERRSELAEEYKLLINRWEDLDRRTLTVKGWVTAGGFIAIFNIDNSTPDVMYAGAIVLLVTAWFVEAIWKGFHVDNKPRIELLESFFRGEISIEEVSPFQMQTSLIDKRAGKFPASQQLSPDAHDNRVPTVCGLHLDIGQHSVVEPPLYYILELVSACQCRTIWRAYCSLG